MNKKILSAILTAGMFFLAASSAFALPTLSFDEYVSLSKSKNTTAEIQNKIDTILNTPVVDNSFGSEDVLPHTMKVINWNLEGGAQLHQISALFLNGDKVISLADEKILKDREKKIALQTQIKSLQRPDIIFLTDVDWGRPESGYKNVAYELAHALGYNYAFGVDFIGTDPYTLGVQPDYEGKYNKEINKSQYRGLSGHAILSKYPLSNVRIIRLPDAYNWYDDEKEYAKDMASMKEKNLPVKPEPTDVKIGGRIALLADVTLPGDVKTTLIAIETEDRTKPKNRAVQVQYFLSRIKDISNPVVIGANLNTNNQDTSPNDPKRFFRKNFDGQNMIKNISAKFVQNGSIISSATGIFNSSRVKNDPTSPSVPIFANNKEKATFDLFQDFRFDDKEIFEFKRERTIGDNASYDNYLGTTNERGLKGFVPTYSKKALIGYDEYKLDWFFVKPDEVLYPYNPKTLDMFSTAFAKQISSHNPMTIELHIKEK